MLKLYCVYVNSQSEKSQVSNSYLKVVDQWTKTQIANYQLKMF